jgi:hypothetical protein
VQVLRETTMGEVMYRAFWLVVTSELVFYEAKKLKYKVNTASVVNKE